MLINTSLLYRHIFNSSKDHVIISADYSSMEARIAAFLSRDPIMLNAFNSPDLLTDTFEIVETVNNEEIRYIKEITYNNPAVDIHTLTGQGCYPDVFIDVPAYQIVDTAKNTIRDGMAIRKSGKVINFSIIFGSSAQSVSDNNFVKLKVAERWVDGHKRTYPQFHKWAANEGRIASYRGWANTQLGRCRWVQEENSKGNEGGLERLAVSHAIQG